MNSPLHPEVVMQATEIEPGLFAQVCPKSGGVWIPLASYFVWREKYCAQVMSPPKDYSPVPVDDSNQRALICPESGRLLLRYRVGHGLQFHIDRSPVTGGVWLDKGEWEALKSRGLHAEMHLVFTASYQRNIRTAQYDRTMEQTFRERIGPDDFVKAAQFKDWLAAHPRRREIYSYLMQDLETGESAAGPKPG